MPQKLTLDGLAKKVQGQKDRHDHLEKEVKALKDLLNVHDNWHAEIRNWLGKVVNVDLLTGREVQGLLLWTDRYNICISPDLTEGGKRHIYSKGAIVCIRLGG